MKSEYAGIVLWFVIVAFVPGDDKFAAGGIAFALIAWAVYLAKEEGHARGRAERSMEVYTEAKKAGEAARAAEAAAEESGE